jgi:murein tripeptide amidase MpaA
MFRPRAAALGRVLIRVIAPAALLAACSMPPGRPPEGGAPASLVTEAERSRFQRTGRYDEVERMCRAFEQAYPGRARCVTFGTTPEGRPMLAIVASADGVLDPEAARAKRRPVILLQAGIHAGEIEGKDGGLWALREMLDGKLAPGALGAVTAVFVPVFNADGHERFGKNHRPNQRGPEEMGFRTTGQNLNLNRDYVKAEAPEMHAMLALFEAWDPVVYADLHTTDGAKFQHDVAVLVAPKTPRSDGLDVLARGLSDALQARLTSLGHLPLPFYPSFIKDDDPSSGFSAEPGPPRFSQHYAAARNRIGVLVETHSWATYERRVRTMHDFLAALFERATTSAVALRAAADAADARGARLAGAPVALTYRAKATPRPIEFRGYAYEKRPSEISGGAWIIYDESRPEIWRVPLFDELEPELTVTAPRAGYVVPAAHAAFVAAKLRLHGLRYQVMKAARPAFAVEAFRADEVTFGRSFEGRTPAKVKGASRPERRDLPAGSLFVPIAQPRALLLLHLMEPLAPDSLVAWGFLNSCFERKEYMEDYIAEEEARKMLAADPALRAQFEARLKDPVFAQSPRARLDFFYQRHPAWDERVNLIPMLRVAASPLDAAP